MHTVAWQMVLEPEAGLGNHRVVYSAAARGVLFPEADTVWQGSCRWASVDTHHGRDLRRDNGRLLKQHFSDGAAACADQLWVNYTGASQRPAAPQ